MLHIEQPLTDEDLVMEIWPDQDSLFGDLSIRGIAKIVNCLLASIRTKDDRSVKKFSTELHLIVLRWDERRCSAQRIDLCNVTFFSCTLVDEFAKLPMPR
jgi:hypothetical protein